ncbi:Myb-like DNA-binding domain protein [Mortierella alpina]|uniref:Myb-like DNA-binding domain protein n=1 Tax=Mortierella alpina TaxID=64518 RepID=A0A9P6J148_MORAP|nr:Myb-like DNA-binding domain protein [Mortierella alpina]
MTQSLRASMLPYTLVEETQRSSASDRIESRSNPLDGGFTTVDFYRNSALFPAGIYETNYGRTIRLLLDPQRAPLQWNQTSSFIQQPIVVMMMTRGRMSHVDQDQVLDSSSSSLQETGSLSQKGARSDLKKRSSENQSSSSQATSLASSSVDCARKPSKKRKIEEQGHHHQGNEKSTSGHVSQPLARDTSHSLSKISDMGKEDEGLEDEVPIKSGRWSAAEDAALFQGVRNHLASLGLELQPPVNLPSEAELGACNEPTGGALATASLQGPRREHFTGATSEDSPFFDSIVNTSYYLDGVDSSHASSIETHPPVLFSVTPPCGSSGTSRHGTAAVGSNIPPTAFEARTVVRNGSHSGLEHFCGHPSHIKFSTDTAALFEALSVAASHIRTSVKRDQGDIQQDDAGDSSGANEMIFEQQNGHNQGCPSFMAGDQQVYNVSLTAWPHSVQLPLSPRTLHRSVDAYTHAWTYPGLPHTADTQQDSHQLVSHLQHHPQSTVTCSQTPSVSSAIPVNCGLPSTQPTAAALTQQQQRGSNLHSNKVSAVDAYWYPPSALHFDSIVHTNGAHGTHLLDDRVSSISTGNNPVSHPSELDPLNYLEHRDDYSCCTNLPGKFSDRFKRAQHQPPDQHHPLLCPPYLNFTRSPSTRNSHSQSPVSFSLPPSSRNSPRLSSAVHPSAFAALDSGIGQYIHNNSTGTCEGASSQRFEQPDPSLHNHGHVHGLSADPNLGLAHESHSTEMHSLPSTRESYALAISRAMTTCPWNKITRQSIPGRTGVQAQARWSEALDPQVKKGKWSAEEDVLLLKGAQESHKCWIWIADGIPGRTQRQCRTRWVQISTRAEREAAAAAVALAKGQARGMCAL